MASSHEPPIEKLSNELLLQIAGWVERLKIYSPKIGTTTSRRTLLNLAIVSKRMYPIAQDTIFRNVDLRFWKVNNVQLLHFIRTLLFRPELGLLVRKLSLCLGPPLDRKQLLHFKELQKSALAKLEALGFKKGTPWYTSIKEREESAYGGLALALVPNLVEFHLECCSSDPVRSLFGYSNPPSAVIPTLRHIKELSIPCDHVSLLCTDFESLESLDLGFVSAEDVLNFSQDYSFSLSHASKIKTLRIAPDIQFAQDLLPLELGLGGLFEAMACDRLIRLIVSYDINMCTDHTDMDSFNVNRIMSELGNVSPTLEELVFRTSLGGHNSNELFMEIAKPVNDMQQFTALKRLAINGLHLFGTTVPRSKSIATILPSSLEELEIIDPNCNTFLWLEGILSSREYFSNLKSIVLDCCGALNMPALNIHETGHPVWEKLRSSGINCLMRWFRNIYGETLYSTRREVECRGTCWNCGMQCGMTTWYVLEEVEMEDKVESENTEIDHDGV